MAKKKKGAKLGEPQAVNASLSPSPIPSPSPSPVPPPSPPLSAAGSSSTSTAPPVPQTSADGKQRIQRPIQSNPAALLICRNKHWRFISSFHGPWLQLPLEVLTTLAHVNYNAPRPRPIDPSVFFDIVKIRRLVEDATNLCVKAKTGVSMLNPNGGNQHAQSLGLGVGEGRQAVSKERRHRMREQATQKLAKAYRIDEIACSVATMQSSSPLEDVALSVQTRHPDDPDAKYVHFFHEKIPSRKLAESTSLAVLNEIIMERRTDPEPYRTRATVRIFKDDYEGALVDLTEALRLHRLYRPPHTDVPSTQELQLAERSQQRNGWRPDDIILKDDEQPSGLELQLLFQRAGVYLTLAWHQVAAGLANLPSDTTSSPTPAARAALEARQSVRNHAKRALRDLTLFLSAFDYSPDLSVDIADHFARKVNHQVNGIRYVSRCNPIAHPASSAIPHHRVYPLTTLFSAAPPSDLPIFPNPLPPNKMETTEYITYHPLLPDALHSLLLCHVLLRTPTPLLLSHAYMVARLTRLSDGHPIFQSARSPARADWIELVRAAIPDGPVPELTSPALRAAGLSSDLTSVKSAPAHVVLPALLPMMAAQPGPAGWETREQRAERRHQEAVIEALGDERVVDGDTLEQAIEVRKRRAAGGGGMGVAETPIMTERAAAVARWFVSAPAAGVEGSGIGGAGKRRKKKKGMPGVEGGAGELGVELVRRVEGLSV